MLGLGGMRFIDYADPSDPLLFVDTSDYTWFPMDKDLTRLYLEATDEGDIMLCPGNRTYMQMLNRQGFSEMAVMSKTHTDPSGWRYVGLHPGMYMRQVGMLNALRRI